MYKGFAIHNNDFKFHLLDINKEKNNEKEQTPKYTLNIMRQ